MLVLAVAGGAWALFGRDQKDTPANAIGPQVRASASATNKVFGPAVPGAQRTPAVSPTSTGPVAATPSAAATSAPKPSPSAAPVTPPAPSAAPPTTPAVTGAQQGGTVAPRDYTFKVARGDTLWGITKQALSRTGRSTSNANVAVYVQRLYQHNATQIGSDPNLILTGQTVVWPQGL